MCVLGLRLRLILKGRFTPNATREIVARVLVCSVITGDPRIRVAFASQVPRHCCSRSDAFALRVGCLDISGVMVMVYCFI